MGQKVKTTSVASQRWGLITYIKVEDADGLTCPDQMKCIGQQEKITMNFLSKALNEGEVATAPEPVQLTGLMNRWEHFETHHSADAAEMSIYATDFGRCKSQKT